MFNNTETGFMMTFTNGYSISVQWGPGHYCGNRSGSVFSGFQPYESKTAEIAAFRPDESYLQLGVNDDVAGWVLADEVAEYIAILSGPNPEDACHKISTWTSSGLEERYRRTTGISYFAGHSQESTEARTIDA